MAQEWLEKNFIVGIFFSALVAAALGAINVCLSGRSVYGYVYSAMTAEIELKVKN